MTLYAFRLLSPLSQVYSVLRRGTFLAQRQQEDGSVSLYHMADEEGGFLVEVGPDKEGKQRVVLRSFMSSEPLEGYSQYVRLP
jgi:hypothetical protein